MPRPLTQRLTYLIAAAASLLVAAFAVAPSADASTLYACVKKNGSAHVYTKKPKCKKGEKRLSWNTEGPAGKNGANGTNGTAGTNGINGAVAGFSATATGVNYRGASEGSPATIVSKALPAGNFIVQAKTELIVSDTKTGGEIITGCNLIDTPSGGGTTVKDTATWFTLINVPFIFVDLADTTIPFGLAVNSPSHASTVSLVCYPTSVEASGGTVTAEADNAVITAVQTSSNA